MNRRNLMSCVALTLPLVALGCATGTALSAQVLADTNAALAQLKIALPALEATKPPVLTSAQVAPLLVDIAEAQSFLATVSANVSAVTGATVLAQVLGYFNAVLDAIPVALVPAPFTLIVVAATVIAQEVEAYIVSIQTPVTPTPTPAAKRYALVAHGMTLTEARQHLAVAQ